MQTFRLLLAYDGAGFVGWQRQAAGTSIQGLIEQVLADLDRREVTVVGAGRTDAGVHALGQVASFSLERAIDAATLQRALNGRLPAAVRVLAADEVADGFHARFDARSKTYRYRLWNGDVMSPFERGYAWHVSVPLVGEAMCQAAKLLEGRHDFAAFQAADRSARPQPSDVKTTTERVVLESSVDVRTVAEAGIPAGRLLTYVVSGTGFLRHMVRNIVGTLVEIGQGRRSPEWMLEVVASRDRSTAGPTAPAHGLFLVGVDYAPVLAAER